MYYRFTNSENPMSDWGHAMMCDTEDSVQMYGENEYIYDGANATRIEDLKDEIIAKWNECLEDEFFGNDVPYTAEEWFKTLSADEVFSALNPSDIVMSAEGYDCELVCWLWENVLEPKEIYAVLTEDGAVVFDDELLQKVEIND